MAPDDVRPALSVSEAAAQSGRADLVLIFAPDVPDGPLAAAVLRQAGLAVALCADPDALRRCLDSGAGAAIVTEEALTPTVLDLLNRWVAAQAPWSELPFVLLTRRFEREDERQGTRIMEALANVAFLERPFHPLTLVSVVRSALGARRRQYDMRDYLAEREAAAERLARSERELRQLNETLEERVAAEIEQRERAQATLLQAQKMDAMGQLTGGIAHDFNNLLTAVSGNLELISAFAENADVQRLAESARQTLHRGTRLTSQLLAFARQKPLNLQPVDLRALLAGMNDLLTRSIGPTITIQTRPERDADRGAALTVSADPNQLELAILNLAINARDAMPAGGTLTISTGPAAPGRDVAAGDYLAVTITDTGCGMTPEVLARAMDPFFTTKPVGKGTGLGLSQVYGFARQCGGAVRLESRVGVGTRISIVLPRATAASASALETTAVPVLPRGRAERVMIVDDDDDVRGFVAEALTALGYTVSTAPDAAACLRALRGGARPDLLVVDFAMPGMTGGELASEIAADDPLLPIVFATGFAEDAAMLGLDRSAITLRKPFRMTELASTLRSVLERAAAG